uniref:Molybdopterin dehydrogenase FAD-binding domain protein n=1 Tax=uncultured organism TaxID=155900 RepID=M1P1C6_9ZZZZ|nr:molybdopterin dehydrogenase FAD-binding domain protein [uncultured organism]
MALPEFNLHEPETMEELKELLSEYGEEAKILAGGTDLIADLRNRIIKPDHLINIKNIEELNKIDYDGEELTVGATVTADTLTKSDKINDFQALKDGLELHSDPILRNRATLVGNLCTASPAGDTPPALLVLNAKVDTIGPNGGRTIELENFFTGVKSNALEDDEIVKQLRIPKPDVEGKSAYLKWKRNEGEDLAVVGVAAKIDEDNELSLALSSVAPTPAQIPGTEDILKSGSKEEQIEEAVEKVEENISPITDARGEAEYRDHMAKVLTKRILNQLVEEK